MTSNTEPSGEVSASSYYIGGDTWYPWMAFDKSTNTLWEGDNHNDPITTSWIQYKFPNAISLKCVYMQAPLYDRNKFAKSFDVYGSNDGKFRVS